MKRLRCGMTTIALALVSGATAGAQGADTASVPLGLLTLEQQVAAALLPLPPEFRDDAIVLGYRSEGSALDTVRNGKGPFTCLAPAPEGRQFHAACYHTSLEPFMARGRELRRSGVNGDQVDTVRFREVDSGQLRMPSQPAMLYSLTGPVSGYDRATGELTGARPLFVVYIPGATAASTGLSEKPAVGTPWLMFPGTPKAHIMFVPRM